MKINSIESTEELQVSHNPKIKKHVLVSGDEIENVTNFSRAVFPPGEIASAHSHRDMTEIFFIESGLGVLSVNEKSIPLESGMCVTIEPGEMHELKNTGSSDMVVLCFGIKTECI
ncbi:MAG TPA: cupin domain-containing protein [Geopsychrobacteraceae bacterium]|nr:cupin domain-containing protein [Geopsychrobacteraceae bacterium]